MTRPPFMADRVENEITFARLIDHLIIWSPDGIWNNRRPVSYAVDILQNMRTIYFATGNHNSIHYILLYCISINALITTLEISVIITISYNYISHQIISNHITLVLIAYMPRKNHHCQHQYLPQHHSYYYPIGHTYLWHCYSYHCTFVITWFSWIFIGTYKTKGVLLALNHTPKFKQHLVITVI